MEAKHGLSNRKENSYAVHDDANFLAALLSREFRFIKSRTSACLDDTSHNEQTRWTRRFRYRRGAIVAYSDGYAEIIRANAFYRRFLRLPSF